MEITQQILPILISISLVSVFLTGYYKPINPARDWFTEKWIGFFVRHQMYRIAEVSIVWNCAKCMSFIVALTLTWNLPGAILSSILALIIKYIIEYVSRDN